jgi:uncharacterized protein
VRLSRFNQYISDFPTAGSTLVYNTLTGAFLEIDDETRQDLERLDRGEVSLDDIYHEPAWFDEDAQFLVTSHDVDERSFSEWYESMRSHTDVMQALVSVTFACNLDCSYCCQSDVMDGKTMTPASGEATAAFLAGRAIAIGARRLDVTFVGGEPLLQQKRIEDMVHAMRGLLEPHGIALKFSLITNGVFMTRALVERWVELGLYAAQVTLDGDDTTHAITRRSKKNAPDSYPTIFKNVIDCSGLISIIVNGNYQPDTISGFPGLIAKLRDAGLGPGTRMHFSPALNALGAPSDSAAGSCTMGGANPEWMLGLRDRVVRAGFEAGDPVSIGPCAFHLRHFLAVDPFGNIYKCPGVLGKEEWAIGHVATGLTSAYDRVVESRPHEKNCGSCAHRPDCAGGCVAADWIAKGKEGGINCEHEYFERTGDDLVKRKYVETMADGDRTASVFDLIPDIALPSSAGGRGGNSSGRRSSALRVLAA